MEYEEKKLVVLVVIWFLNTRKLTPKRIISSTIAETRIIGFAEIERERVLDEPVCETKILKQTPTGRVLHILHCILLRKDMGIQEHIIYTESLARFNHPLKQAI